MTDFRLRQVHLNPAVSSAMPATAGIGKLSIPFGPWRPSTDVGEILRDETLFVRAEEAGLMPLKWQQSRWTNEQSALVVKRLRRGAAVNGRLVQIAESVAKCGPNERCGCVACVDCATAFQTWSTRRSLALINKANQTLPGPFKCMSVVPAFGRIALGEFSRASWETFDRKLKLVMRKAGVDFFLGGIDISVNHSTNPSAAPGLQLHVWGIYREHDDFNRLRLLQEVRGQAARPDGKGGICTREGPRQKKGEAPIWTSEFDGRENAYAYALKPNFCAKRPFWVEASATHNGYWDYDNRPMSVGHWLMLTPVLHDMGLQSRVFNIGVKRGRTAAGWDYLLLLRK